MYLKNTLHLSSCVGDNMTITGISWAVSV